MELAGRHSCVVRLKGGDPFVFGRGGEEAQVLAQAGIDWEVVPGISSAYAVPAYAGIPVTQRGVAAQFTVVTGHEDPTKPESDLDWASLASTPGTLVFLMGVRALRANAARLIEQGMPTSTPAAVVSHGTRPGQRTVVAPLSEIAEAAADLPAPAITLVGAVASLRQQLAWYERRPLFGLRVVVTRARAQASGLAARLSELGAQVVEAPGISIEPLEFQPPDLASYDIVCLTSANGVERLLAGDVRSLHGVTVAAVGRATADALAARGIVADVVPQQAVSDALPDALGEVGRQAGAGGDRGGGTHGAARRAARAGRDGRRCCTSTGRCASRSIARRWSRPTWSRSRRHRPSRTCWERWRRPTWRRSGRSRSGRSRAGRCERTASSRWSRPIRTTSRVWSRRCCGRRR